MSKSVHDVVNPDIYLLAILLCVVAIAGFGTIEPIFYAVLFPAITVLSILLADYLDKHISIEVHHQK